MAKWPTPRLVVGANLYFLKSVFGLVSTELGTQHCQAWNVSSSGLKLGMHQALAVLFFINKFIVERVK